MGEARGSSSGSATRQVFTGMALRVGGEPEREVFMCAGEGPEEEVRVLLGRGRREAVTHLV